MLPLDVTAITPQVVKKLNPSLERYARRLVSRSAEADDLVQETWCSAILSIHLYRGEASLLTWLRRIMERRLADRLRKQRQTVELDEDTMEARHTRTPYELVSRASDDRALSTAMRELSSLERRAVLLCDLEELERDEAAACLSVKRGHLRVILHRARRKLERALVVEQGAGLPRVA